LRSGKSIWELDGPHPTVSSPGAFPHKADILIIGAGITGSFLAERLIPLRLTLWQLFTFCMKGFRRVNYAA
jgi:hypothetical protein